MYPEIGIDAPAGIQPTARQPGEPLRVLFAGRLLGWKGAHLAIRAVAQAVAQGVPVEFTLLGKGPFEPELRKVAAEAGVQDSLRWVSHMPQQELFALYRTMHCFLFPSLHDSSGNVVLEAQANGLPVICLDIGGPATLVTAETAIVVATRNRNEAGVVQGLADAIRKLVHDEQSRVAMSRAAAERVREKMSWDERANGVLPLVDKALGRDWRGTVKDL
ncbi:glycosyltransferase family 4 protein [Immundisolibacter cernigliae]|uniref:Glycosyl transferase family 1 domain-containing protein n=1 Tax=Immundisolibacter cernigliae TaxID=1810504 RepID=A0A1B1YQN6_9GAMM|nr:glycosyltransferase family 4 protein [Immundisolibacter cernigliae]ANX03080.1 hypothetical protein PG2T_02010 [Immundisolibacter cernigliae]